MGIPFFLRVVLVQEWCTNIIVDTTATTITPVNPRAKCEYSRDRYSRLYEPPKRKRTRFEFGPLIGILAVDLPAGSKMFLRIPITYGTLKEGTMNYIKNTRTKSRVSRVSIQFEKEQWVALSCQGRAGRVESYLTRHTPAVSGVAVSSPRRSLSTEASFVTVSYK